MKKRLSILLAVILVVLLSVFGITGNDESFVSAPVPMPEVLEEYAAPEPEATPETASQPQAPPETQAQIDAKALKDVVFLHGTRDNPYAYMKGCDVLVQSSRYEGKSVVLDEAKMLCTPIVATAYPTVGDQVQDGLEGIVIPMTAEGIADGVQRMLEDASLRGEITAYLAAHEYGNQQEVAKYMALLG